MRKKIVLLTLIVAVTLVFSSIASFAAAPARGNFTGKSASANYFGGQGQGKGPSGQGYDRSFQGDEFRGMMNIDLSEEQIAEIRQMMLDFQKESFELRNQIQMKQLEMRELMLEDSIDMDQVRAKLEEISQLQVEVRVKAIERQTKIQDLLTPEQLENCGLGLSMQRFKMGNMGNNNFSQGFNQGFKGNQGNRW